MKIYLIFIFALFIFFGFDIRKNALAKSFVSIHFIITMKLCCLLLFVIYIFSVLNITQINKICYLTATSTTFGTLLVMWAKITLGKNFAWTGYYLTKSEKIIHGPYKYMKHPLYYGIYLVEIGSTLLYLDIIWQKEKFLLMLGLGTIPLLYALAFNLIMSRKESSRFRVLS